MLCKTTWFDQKYSEKPHCEALFNNGFLFLIDFKM